MAFFLLDDRIEKKRQQPLSPCSACVPAEDWMVEARTALFKHNVLSIWSACGNSRDIGLDTTESVLLRENHPSLPTLATMKHFY